MFRIKKSDIPRSIGVAAWAMAGLLLVAWVLSMAVTAAALGRTEAPAILAAPVSVALVLALVGFAWYWRRMVASQESLRQLKLLAHDILASMEQGVVTTDTQRQITSINSGAMKLLGVDDEYVGVPLLALTSDALPLDALGRRVIDRHERVRDLEFAVDRQGRAQRLLVSAHELSDGEGRSLGCVIHIRDVTERMRMKEQMWRLERLSGLSTLAAGLHHEIKNPLTALSIHVQLIEERLRGPHAAEPIDELLGVLKSEVRRLNGVLERFRNFASLDRMTLVPSDPAELLEDVVRLMGPQAERQGVQMRLDRSAPASLPAPGSVMLDEEKFREAVINLVVNGLDAMPAGGDLTLSARSEADALVVEVADTGPGIPEEVLADVFRPYVSTKPQGTGMGLALTDKLISQHGGSVTFQTGPEGTVFRLSVPLAQKGTPRAGTPAGALP
jgi:PAS domain S-box-containing protein